MSGKRIFFNGINGSTGEYLLPPMTAEQVAYLSLDARPEEREWLARIRKWAEGDGSRSPIFDSDPRNLAETGWGVVYAPGTPDRIRAALSPLLSHRRDQAGEREAFYYKEYEHQTGETALQFLRRNGARVGAAADPDLVPYYLLLVGDPEAIPFTFQTALDVNYAVGRIYFDAEEDYERYARSVVDAETGKLRSRLPRQVSLFGVRNEGDPATRQTADELVRPLADTLVETEKGWELRTYLGAQADKAQLTKLLGGPDVPSLLFTACHGVGFPPEDARQPERQGALVCQDWPGPNDDLGLTQDDYFAAEDLPADAHVHGLVAFLFASYSAGTPARDNFEQKALGKPLEIAKHAFVSRLPQRLLSHPNGGALAIVGHVDRAWTTSVERSSQGEWVDNFRNALRRLLRGHTVGWAMEYFNAAHAVMSAELADLWESQHFLENIDQEWFSYLWMAHNDARSLIVFGDPAVKLIAT